ncbi:hypothetical protein DYB36_004209 [Aphanomyces astaci]|uniref:Uncharacterized protein n=1 Tax=Aphanomyces astaci TaxID=112090 RepID=A0A397B1J5_APHAT|nr:hypothetical protein DYB36_004209 [Aphanomyces astaci]
MNCHDAVGCVVEVFSDVTKVWCQGRIDEYDPQVGYRVMYDDGNEQWEGLSDPDRVHVVQPSRANMEGYAEGVHVIPTENTIADEKCAMTPPPDLDDVIVDPRVSRESADNDNAIESTTQVYHLQSTKGGQLAPSCRQSSSDVPDDEVEAVTERDMTACHVFVKVHVVSPGPGSVHLRCKRAIHTTQLHVCGGGGAWDDSIWTHTFTDDESVDLNTALLYAVYLAESDNIFLGHVLIPISHFSRGVVVQDEEFALVSRQGKVVAGLFLRLQHQVVLVTTFPTAVPPVKSTPVPDTPKLAKPSKTVDGKPRNLQSTDQKVKPVATRRVHRLVQPKSASGNQKQQALHAKASTIYSAKRRPKPSSNAKLPLPSTYDTQVQLVEDVAALQASVAQAEAQVLRLTAMLSRLDISHGKLKSTAGCLKRLMLAMSALAQDEVATSKSLGDVLDDLQRGRRQLRWLTDPTRKIADDDAFLAQRYTVLMDLKVQVATLHEQESMYQQSAADPIDNVVESKVDARRKKLDQLEQEIAIHRGQYNQMVHDQSSHDLKQKVNDMHLMLLMVSNGSGVV